MKNPISEKKKVKIYFYLWILGAILLFVLFFWYGFHFNTWGKKFSEIPKYVKLGDDGIFVLFILFLVCFIRFYNRNYDNLLNEREKQNLERQIQNQKGITKSSLIAISILALICLYYLLASMPWTSVMNINGKSEIARIEAPLWDLPRDVYFQNKLYHLKPKLNIKEFSKNLILLLPSGFALVAFYFYKKKNDALHG
jgi:uncharacterized membrane protein YbaN (DUF454 family)